MNDRPAWLTTWNPADRRPVCSLVCWMHNARCVFQHRFGIEVHGCRVCIEKASMHLPPVRAELSPGPGSE